MRVDQISPDFDHVEYISRSIAFYKGQVESGTLSGPRLEATKTLVVALTIAHEQLTTPPAEQEPEPDPEPEVPDPETDPEED